MTNTVILKKAKNGELSYEGLGSYIKQKYKADTPLDHSFVPYLIMLFCAVVDASVFISLFEMISYDSPFMIGIEVAGFLFAFDVVPVYIGIQLRRLNQGITKDRFILWMALAVCVMAFALNIVLRINTIRMMSPDLSSSSVSFMGEATVQEASTEVDPTALSLTIFGIVLPFLTSLGSFYISYLTYDPLKSRKRNLEEMRAEKADEVRRFDALLGEYECDKDFAERLEAEDLQKYRLAQNEVRAKVLGHCEYVKQRLKEHLATPTAVSALSEDTCIALLARLDQELASFEAQEEDAENELLPYEPAAKSPVVNQAIS